MGRWLARLGFSFFIIAAVLFWQAYQQWHINPHWRRLVFQMAGGLLATALGIIGMREQHRRQP